MRRFLKNAAILGAILLFVPFVKHQTHQFTVARILSPDLPYHPILETRPPESLDSIKTILSQPFRLIGAGSECFVFMSQDKKTVIKFFKLELFRFIYFKKGLFYEDHRESAGILSNHYLTKIFLKEPFHSLKNRYLGIRESRLLHTFESCKIAYEELKKETGLIYLHLNPTHCFNQMITLIDANGIQHEIPLDSTKFLLQKKAIPLETYFENCIQSHSLLEAKEAIDSLLSLIVIRCKKGISNRDSLNRNLGLIGNQVTEIDLGSFSRNPELKEPTAYQQEIPLATAEFRQWLQNHSPELHHYFEERLSFLNIN